VSGGLDYRIGYPVAIALACAVALGVACFAAVLLLGLAAEPELVDAQADQGERESARPPGPGEFPPDLAWPFYPFRQWRADLAATGGNTLAAGAPLAGTWRWFTRTAPGWWLLPPVPLVPLAFLLVATVTCWACYLVFALVAVLVTAASRVLLVPAAAGVRAAERGRRAAARSQAACMNCFHVTEWPAFRCPRCDRLHRDVRPGRLGLFFRRCGCGWHLPLPACRATWRAAPVCQRCGADLPPGAGGVRDIRVPVFGDTSAGKTRFLYASLGSLLQSAARARLAVSFPDEPSREQAEYGLNVLRSGRDTAKTSPNADVALTVRLGSGRRCELLHLFDAAGENFRSARRPDALRFLDDGHGLVYILDPFSVDAVTRALGGTDAPAVRQAQAAAGDPELTYGEVASRLRDGGVPASRGRLAIVVSKADLLRAAGLSLPAGSRATGQWLRDHGLHNLVLSARRDFAEVRFFTVASQDVPPGAADDPGAPLRWLLRLHGSQLPAEPADSLTEEPAGPAAGDEPDADAAGGVPGQPAEAPR
jgi:Double-GTPase 2